MLERKVIISLHWSAEVRVRVGNLEVRRCRLGVELGI
jgi:hypothetical protein